MENTEEIFMSISFPSTITKEEALERAKKLVPSTVGEWFEIDSGDGYVCGNMECEDGFYGKSDDYNKYGPDDAGVVVEWEKS